MKFLLLVLAIASQAKADMMISYSQVDNMFEEEIKAAQKVLSGIDENGHYWQCQQTQQQNGTNGTTMQYVDPKCTAAALQIQFAQQWRQRIQQLAQQTQQLYQQQQQPQQCGPYGCQQFQQRQPNSCGDQ